MKYIREKGRPASDSGRLEKEIRSYDFLDALGVEYERIDHEAVMTIDACQEIDTSLEAMICKNLFLSNRKSKNFYLLLVSGEKMVNIRELSNKLGISRLQFAKAEYMEEFLDITPGSVSVLGLMNDKDHRVQLLVDKDLLSAEFFGCHPCINTSSLRITTKDLIEKIIPGMKHQPIYVDV